MKNKDKLSKCIQFLLNMNSYSQRIYMIAWLLLEKIILISQSLRRYDRLRREELRDEKIDCSHLARFGALTAEQQ